MTLHEIVATDPLAPLTGEEIETVVAVLRQAEGLGAQHRFVRIDLREPPKADVEKWQPGVPVDRCGLAVVFDRAENATYEAVVSIPDRALRSFTPIPGVQPEVMADEFEEAERAVKESPLFRAALAKRGIDDVEALCVDPWSAGSYGTDDRDRRLMRCLAWVRLGGPNDNAGLTQSDIIAIGRSSQVARCPIVLGDAVAPTFLPLARQSDLVDQSAMYARDFTVVNPHQPSALGCAIITVLNQR